MVLSLSNISPKLLFGFHVAGTQPYPQHRPTLTLHPTSTTSAALDHQQSLKHSRGRSPTSQLALLLLLPPCWSSGTAQQRSKRRRCAASATTCTHADMGEAQLALQGRSRPQAPQKLAECGPLGAQMGLIWGVTGPPSPPPDTFCPLRRSSQYPASGARAPDGKGGEKSLQKPKLIHYLPY